MNSGKNGGRVSWVLTGTMCGGKIQGTFAAKLANCMKCEFYQLVLQEEGPNYINAKAVLEQLK